MTMRLNPYINFRTTARDALEFYHSVFGGELNIMTFSQGGMPHDPAQADLVMHGQLDTPAGFTLMLSDTPESMPLTMGGNISVSLSGDDEATLSGYYNALLVGGETLQPLVKAPWGDTFGMLTDKFGVTWLCNISGQPQ
jgi:PhnB protein